MRYSYSPLQMGNLRLQEQNLLTGTRSKVQREDLNLGPHPSTVHLLSLLEGNTGKKAGDFTDVPRSASGTHITVGVNSGAGGMWVGRRLMTITSIFPGPPTPFSSLSTCWCTQDIYCPEEGKVPPTGAGKTPDQKPRGQQPEQWPPDLI